MSSLRDNQTTLLLVLARALSRGKSGSSGSIKEGYGLLKEYKNDTTKRCEKKPHQHHALAPQRRRKHALIKPFSLCPFTPKRLLPPSEHRPIRTPFRPRHTPIPLDRRRLKVWELSAVERRREGEVGALWVGRGDLVGRRVGRGRAVGSVRRIVRRWIFS